MAEVPSVHFIQVTVDFDTITNKLQTCWMLRVFSEMKRLVEPDLDKFKHIMENRQLLPLFDNL